MDNFDGDIRPPSLIIGVQECPRKVAVQNRPVKFGLRRHDPQQLDQYKEAERNNLIPIRSYLDLPSLGGEFVLHSKVRQAVARKFLAILN